MRNRRTRITFPVFRDYEVRVIQSHDIAATGRRLRENLEGAAAAYITREEDGITGKGWLILGPNPSPEDVAHECFHAVEALFKWIGAENRDEEAFAYHLDYLVGRVHKFLKGKR